jgi:hypothetical protein
VVVIFAAIALGVATRAPAQAVPVPDVETPQPQQSISPPPSVPAPVPPVAVPSTPAPEREAKTPSEPPASAIPGPGRFVLWMHDGTCLMGVFGETKAVPFDSIMGKIEIPMTSIHTVDFSFVINGAKTHRVYLINGDMLTGNVGQLAPVKFRTSYGMLTVPMDDVMKLSAGAPPLSTSTGPPTNQLGGAGEKKSEGFAPVPVPDEPPGPIRPLRRFVPDEEVR